MEKPIREIERIAQPSPALFHREYLAKNKPVIITGVANQWRACTVWTPEYFYKSFPGINVKYKSWDGDETQTDPEHYLKNFKFHDILLGDFLKMIMEAKAPTKKFYLSQFPIFGSIPQLIDDVGSLKPFMGIPRYYRMRSKLKITLAPSIWVGPAGATSVLHFDSYENLFTQIYGRKRFLLFPPSQSKSVYYPHYEFPNLHFSPVDVEHPDLTRFPLFNDAQPLDFIIEPGEILFIPVRWWHYARSLDASIALNIWWRLGRTVLNCRYHSYIKFRRKLLNKLKRYGMDRIKNL